jgi:hypothetical protein
LGRIAVIGAACIVGSACGGDDGPTDVTDDPPADSGPDRPDLPMGELEPDTDIGDEGQEVWIFMQSHLHTTGFHDCANNPTDPAPPPEGQCYSAEGILAFLQDALANGASDMIITDHNNIDSWFDPAFAPLADIDRTAYATPLRGVEWSSGDGHMTLFFPRAAVDSNAAALEMGFAYAPGNQAAPADPIVYGDTIAAVHDAGGVAIINHPELAIHVFPEDSYGADGVEVGIPPNPLDDVSGGSVGFQASAEARAFWQRRLRAGQRLAGTAGADHHHGGGDIPGLEAPTFGIAINYIRLDPVFPLPATVADALTDAETTIDQRSDAVVDALRRGHVMITESESAPRVFVGADRDGDGRFHDARAGDCLAAAPGDTVRVRVRITQVTAGGGDHFNFLAFDHRGDGEQWRAEVDYETGFPPSPEYTVDPADPYAIELDVPVEASGRGFLRFELERDIVGPVNDTEVVTNPIYLGDWGEECAGSAPLY